MSLRLCLLKFLRVKPARLQAMGTIHGILPGDKVITNVDVFRKLYETVGLGWVYAVTRFAPINNLANRWSPRIAWQACKSGQSQCLAACCSACQARVVFCLDRDADFSARLFDHPMLIMQLVCAGYMQSGPSIDCQSQAGLTLRLCFGKRKRRVVNHPELSRPQRLQAGIVKQ